MKTSPRLAFPFSRCAAAMAVALAVASGSAWAADDKVTVLTSYPDELTSLYEKAFEQAHPGTDVQILWQQGQDAMATLSKPDHGGVDVYWAPALYNFPTLAARGVFAPFGADRKELPGRIGKQPVSDPNGYFEAFEVAGYGIAVNAALLKEKGIAMPISWSDLASPAYSGLVVMPIASRIGFSPQLYDIILQGEGWSKGWALLSEMSANARATDKGGEIIDTVADGKAGAAIAIDFLMRNAIEDGKPIALVYPKHTAFLPAYVAVVGTAPHKDAARDFSRFVLSAEGQKILFRPESGRYPVRPDIYAEAPKDTIDPFTLPADATFAYDLTLGPSRSPLVSAVFDAVITTRAEKVKALWTAIRAAQAKAKNDPRIAEARALAGWTPVTDPEAADPKFLARFEPMGRTPNPEGVALAQSWAAQIDAKQAEALKQAEAVTGASTP